MDTIINTKYGDLKNIGKKYSEQYKNAEPFPNISFDDFFDEELLDKVLNEFPDLSKENASEFNDVKQIKFGGKGELFFERETKKLMNFLNSEPFLDFLQELTGVKEKLIGDPYFLGAGQHEIKKGGLLKIHADFNKYPAFDLDRRLNVLIYLNKDWKESYGGHFELWDKGMKKSVKKILPIFNRMAIFSTTDYSYHGHPDPLNCPEDKSRKSLALYYYTHGRPENELDPSHRMNTTLFKARENNLEEKKQFKNFKKKSIPQKNIIKSIIKNITPPILLKIFK